MGRLQGDSDESVDYLFAWRGGGGIDWLL